MAIVAISGQTRKYKTLGALARGLRLTKRLAQKDAANLCGLTVANIRAIESNGITANYCYDYIFALSNMRKRATKRTSGGKKRAGNLKRTNPGPKKISA